MGLTDDDAGMHDIETERAVLGCAVLDGTRIPILADILQAGDFYRPAHQEMFSALLEMHAEHLDVSTLSAWNYLREHHPIRGVDAVYVSDCAASVPVSANAGWLAGIVASLARRRELDRLGSQLQQQARTGTDTDEVLRGALQATSSLLEGNRAGEEVGGMTAAEFFDQDDDDAYDWIVPGLLERGDRMILTGVEGLGKSTCFQQIAVCMAAGIHPFTGNSIQPRVALYVDCENGTRHLRRKLRPLVHQAKAVTGDLVLDNLVIESRPEGVDLTRQRDQRWLMRMVAKHQPDALFIGSLYRVAPRALTDDDDVAPLLAAFNQVRGTGCCVLIEAHAGHAQNSSGKREMRPRGSSALMGWPEFGFGLRAAEGHTAERRLVDVIRWRGERDERHWPEQLESGGSWPWREAVSGFEPQAWAE